MGSAPRTATPPGMIPEYNHDLDVAEDFLDTSRVPRDLLRDEQLVEKFRQYDDLARRCKQRFHRIGVLSLILGLVPLVFAAGRLILGETRFERLAALAVGGDCCGVAAVALMIWNRVARYRRQWCKAMFYRERLRQWHFQLFLDGELVSRATTDRAAFESERARRWSHLQQALRNGEGMLTQFLGTGSARSAFFHAPTPYTDQGAAEAVIQALGTLRLDHQLGYSGQKADKDAGEEGLALYERTMVSETIATVALAGAVVVTALSFFVSLLGHGAWLANEQGISRVLAGAALLLAVLSAASRAYRTGFTVPEEPESYREYLDRVRELRGLFNKSRSAPDKLKVLELLEAEAVTELRRFLKMKLRATFIS